MKFTIKDGIQQHLVFVLLLFSMIFYPYIIYAENNSATKVTTWDSPGKEELSSKDYQVTLIQGEKRINLFTYFSTNHNVDKVIDGDIRYMKHSLFALHAYQYSEPKNNIDTYAHSWGYFDFEGGPIDVEVKISENVEGLSLPLKSCGIFPSSLGIVCKIVNANTIRFTLDRPVKIAIVPNYLQAIEKLKSGEAAKVYDGYRNPLFLFARAPETNVPDKTATGTLLIKSGKTYTQADFDKASLIYFEKGIHDYSKFMGSDSDNYMILKSKQTMYLEGGAFVYGHVRATSKMLIKDMPVLKGRGTLSGEKNIWTGIPQATNEIRWVRTEGINVTDANNHLSHSVAPFINVAVVGAWHGNTDGITVESGNPGETYTGNNVEDCFVMASDTNLKFRGSAKICNYTIWQLSNAEPIWIADSKGGKVDGIQVICYHKMGGSAANPGQVINAGVKGISNMQNVYVKNVFVETPFISRLFLVNSAYTGEGAAYENVVFENIIVKNARIAIKSSIGNIKSDQSPFGKVTFKNLLINGVKVTDKNFKDYFELQNGVSVGKEIIFE